MPKNILSLQEICTITLLRNHTLVEDIGFVPYRLLRGLLFKLKPSQLMRLEYNHPLLIFEDDEIWYELIKRDFDRDFQCQYTSNKAEILKYFKVIISAHDVESNNLDSETLKNYVPQIIVKNESGHYQIPCRMVYEKLKEEHRKKNDRIAKKVRQATERVMEQKSKNQVTSINDTTILQPRYRNSQLVHKSDIFVDSLKDSQRRVRQFKMIKPTSEKRKIERVAFGGQAGRKLNCDSNAINKTEIYDSDTTANNNQKPFPPPDRSHQSHFESPQSSTSKSVKVTTPLIPTFQSIRNQPTSISQPFNSYSNPKKVTVVTKRLPQKSTNQNVPVRKKSKLFGSSSFKNETIEDLKRERLLTRGERVYIHQK